MAHQLVVVGNGQPECNYGELQPEKVMVMVTQLKFQLAHQAVLTRWVGPPVGQNLAAKQQRQQVTPNCKALISIQF